ncbi:MAG TPA: Stp1/IreP family PP2C-type Ser/Thr phosphatase [Firmicutes bacterium]|nr:Stp1/IreP family PP2C-type Ser/Thr phosphatase [Bacillota bacterium]HBM70816.1 Stp1/IreP family PP2C-type Ser/Thr phosphatase [Bacillota bacterium]HBX24914.1 Stp1/IreP family PP2C-type Ser/Thr phosphatase [Bacillota bacterium]
MKRFKGVYAYKTDIGKVRIANEDQAAVLSNSLGEVLLIVCDGMGGQNKGDCASKLAIDYVKDSFLEKKTSFSTFLNRRWLSKAIKGANSIIYKTANSNPRYKDMGTTLVALLLSGEKMYLANVGDSRCYSFYNGKLTPLTEDQTYVDYLYRTGKISKEATSTREDRHVLMNALGIYPSASFDLKVSRYWGESILLCSDGLYNNLPDTEIRAILSTNDSASDKVDAFIIEANGNGGSDNIAIAYWEAIPND